MKSISLKYFFEKSVVVSFAYFNEYSLIEIGNEVFCTLYYTKDKLVDIELGNVKEKFKDTTDFSE